LVLGFWPAADDQRPTANDCLFETGPHPAPPRLCAKSVFFRYCLLAMSPPLCHAAGMKTANMKDLEKYWAEQARKAAKPKPEKSFKRKAKAGKRKP
jgi:hypothetical protein